jgi:hypothetical protein
MGLMMRQVGLAGRGVEMSDDSRAVEAATVGVPRESIRHNYRFAFIGMLFLMCWAVALLTEISIDREGLGLLSLSGSFGAAVFPWMTGVAGFLLAGRAGRFVGPVASVLVFGALAVIQRL